MMKRLLPLLAGLLLGGCQTTHSLAPAQPDYGQAQFPPVAVVSSGDLPDYRVRNLLRATGQFERIDPAPLGADAYTVLVRNQSSIGKPSGLEQALLVLDSATLFLIPMPAQVDSSFEITVMHGKKTLKQYSYRNHSSSFFQLFHPVGPVQEEHLKRVVDSFVADLQHDGVLKAPVNGIAL